MHMGYLVNIVAEQSFYLIWYSLRALSLCGRESRSFKTAAHKNSNHSS